MVTSPPPGLGRVRAIRWLETHGDTQVFPALTQETLMYARRVFAIAIAIGTLCIHSLAFAQSGGSTALREAGRDDAAIRLDQFRARGE